MTQERLAATLEGIGPLAVAVSGGVDSLTLATLAHRRLGAGAVRVVHAVSPAVPGSATARVRAEAAREGWSLRVIEAGEFADPRYRANPVNRCFFCKTNLYDAVAQAMRAEAMSGEATDRTIVSGTNRDDLGEYRPGLEAARAHGVRHPFVEAGLDKTAVRALARDLGLGAVAELPAAPCLSSRIETGLPIEPDTLAFVHAVEEFVGATLPTRDAGSAVRCRVRAAGVVVELDADSLATLDAAAQASLSAEIVAMAPAALRGAAVRFAPYRTGSAFLTGRIAPAGAGQGAA